MRTITLDTFYRKNPGNRKNTVSKEDIMAQTLLFSLTILRLVHYRFSWRPELRDAPAERLILFRLTYAQTPGIMR